MACGGVNPENAASYLKAGANLLSFGASIYDPKLMNENKWDEIEKRLAQLLKAIK
jgi:2-dehydro-3-deoxyphosphogluconate aldolase/(4S)-4-hydroxy-2-oxoglutarate aldolase